MIRMNGIGSRDSSSAVGNVLVVLDDPNEDF